MYDEEILAVKGGRMVKDDHGSSLDEETKEGTLLEELSSSNPHGSVEVSSLH